jgi:hypothetical protein
MKTALTLFALACLPFATHAQNKTIRIPAPKHIGVDALLAKMAPPAPAIDPDEDPSAEIPDWLNLPDADPYANALPLAPPPSGGTCPSAAQYINTANITGPLVTLASLGVTQCVYFANSGADTNTGLDETHPLLHAPFMPNCASNCSTLQSSFAAGWGIIARGGDTWHYFSGTPLIGLPAGWPTGTNGYAWRPTVSGTITNPVYIGVDKTWFTGASWTRPIITEDNPIFTPSAPNPTLLDSTAVASCAFPSGNLDAMAVTGPTFIVVDNFEWTGMCWNDHTDTGTGTNEHSYIKQLQGGGTGSSPRWFFNQYMHGWSHTRFSCNSITTSSLVSGGSGHAVNDTFGIASPGVAGLFALGHVTSVSGGVVTGYTITDIGTGFNTGNISTTPMGSQPGGSAFTIDITAVSLLVCGAVEGFLGSTQQANFGAVFAFNVVDGSDSDDLTFSPISGDAYDVEENVFRHFGGTDIVSNCHSHHDNLWEFVNNGNDGVGHMDLMFCLQEANVTGGNFHYNNLVRFVGTEYNQASLSAVYWFGGTGTGLLCGGVTCVDFIFNNVYHDVNAQGDYLNIGGNDTGIGPPQTGVVNFKVYNNTIEMSEFVGGGGFSPAFENGAGNAPNMIFTSQNNHYVIPNGATGGCAAAFSSTTNVNGGVTSCAGDIFQTLSVANGQGYNSAGDFQVTSGAGATVGAGANEASLCATFGTPFCSTTTLGVSEGANHTVVFPAVTPAVRPLSAAWDDGTSQFSSSGTVATPTFSPVAGTYTGTQTVTISTATGGATLCYTVNGSTPTAATAGTCDSNGGTEFTFTAPISIAASQTVKSIGTLSGDTNSSVASATYVIISSVNNGIAFPIGFP